MLKTRMFFKFIFLSFLLFSNQVEATGVSVGGYVPFGLSTQKTADGKTNSTSFDPMISISHVMPVPFAHFFMPEFGLVLHGSGSDDYSKRTYFLLLDLGLPIFTPGLLFRYGLGTILTKISADGSAVELPNGSGTATFYRPDKTSTSWNTTLDLGLEYAFTPQHAGRIETFLFSPLSDSRSISYTVNYIIYL